MRGKTKRLLASVLGGLLSVLFVRGLAFATIITVNSLADPGAVHICALRDAITAANTGKITHRCKAGTGNDEIKFSVTGTISLASTLPQITDKHLTIYGPKITIDGGGNVQVMQIGSTAKVTIYDVAVSDGYFTSNTNGAGIDNAGNLTISGSTFKGNGGICDNGCGNGGAIANNGTLTITNSAFLNNETLGNEIGQAGGAIYNTGKATISSSIFDSNDDKFWKGGAIYNAGTFAISNSGLTNNQAYQGGGAIYNAGVITITDANISNNTDVCCCDMCGDAGGILNAKGAYLNITTTTISGNFSGAINGGIDNQGKLTITKSLISGNTAEPIGDGPGTGGGIGSDADLLIINSTIAGNGADSNYGENAGCGMGGGLVTSGGLIINSTIAYNSAASDAECQGEGGGILGPVRLKNSIVAANSGGDCSEPTGDVITDAGYNLADDDSCTFTATSSHNNATVMLAEGLANNGGPTQTIALLQDSPAIDVIPLASCTGLNDLRITTDQREFPRPGTGETMCSIGAYEYQD